MEPKRILISRTDRLGDVVLSTPVIKFMRREFPKAYIAFMIRPYTDDVVRHNTDLDEVIVYDKYGKHNSFKETLRFALNLKKKNFDTAIALHPTNRDHIIFFAAGIPIRIGYNRKCGFLLTKRIKHEKQKGLMHEVDYNFDLLRKAGFKVNMPDRMPYITSGAEEINSVKNICLNKNIVDKFVAVHPGASCPSKRWFPERFAAVSDYLINNSGYKVVLIGDKGGTIYSDKVMSLMKNDACNLTGVLSVGELAELLRRSSLLISNDSGPVHVSVAVGAPVVAIFGRSDPGLSPRRWGPLGEKDIVLHKDVGCPKCLAANCKIDFECLDAVKVDEVIAAASRILI